MMGNLVYVSRPFLKENTNKASLGSTFSRIKDQFLFKRPCSQIHWQILKVLLQNHLANFICDTLISLDDDYRGPCTVYAGFWFASKTSLFMFYSCCSISKIKKRKIQTGTRRKHSSIHAWIWNISSFDASTSKQIEVKGGGGVCVPNRQKVADTIFNAYYKVGGGYPPFDAYVMNWLNLYCLTSRWV